MRATVAVLLAACVLATGSRGAAAGTRRRRSYEHLFPVFRDLDELHSQPARLRKDVGAGAAASRTVHSHVTTYEGADTNLHVAYEAVEHPRHTIALLHPDTAREVVRISCTPGGVAVQLQSPEAANRLVAGHAAGDFVSGACPSVVDEETGEVETAPFYRKVVSSSVRESTVSLVTENVRMQELFDDLNITFKWSPPDRDPVTPHKTRAERAAEAKARQGVSGARSRDRRFLSKIGDALNDFGEKVVDVVSDTVDTVVDTFEKIADGVKAVLLGEKGSFKESFNIVNLNYDPETRKAKNQSMSFYHAPWAVCSDCYFTADLYVDVALEFGSAGIPKRFHAEAGGSVDGKVYARVTNPKIPVSNGMANWHNLVPRQRIHTFNFMVGPVPVRVGVGMELNGAADINKDITANVELGASITASARFGADWSKSNDWTVINEADWSYDYWEPEWDFGISGSGATMYARVSPEVIVTFWEVIPLVVKPKPYIAMNFGAAVDTVKPASLVDNLNCDNKDDQYALVAGVDIGVGIKDIQVPDEVPVLGGIKLIGERDFGQFEVLAARGFEDCGPLCNGCLPRYKEEKQEYLRLAYAASANKRWDAAAAPSQEQPDDGQGGGISGGAIAGIVIGVLVAVALVGILAFLLVKGKIHRPAVRLPRLPSRARTGDEGVVAPEQQGVKSIAARYEMSAQGAAKPSPKPAPRGGGSKVAPARGTYASKPVVTAAKPAEQASEAASDDGKPVPGAPGWTEFVDPSGASYYHNTASGATTWDRPGLQSHA